MSQGHLPMLLATCGYSQDAVAYARGYNQLRAARSAPSNAASTPQSKALAAGQSQAQQATAASQQGQTNRLHSLPLNGKDIGTQHRLTNAEVVKLHSHRHVCPERPSPASSRLLLTAFSIQAPEPVLDSTDFEAIAENSVGGNGIPRPPGHFIASRNGDGRALYQRVPQTKVQPKYNRPQVREEASTASNTASLQSQPMQEASSAASPENSSSMHSLPSHCSTARSHRRPHYPLHPRTKCGRYSLDFGYTHDKQQHDTWVTPPAFRRPSTTGTSKANTTQTSSMWRAQLPSATFLAGVPELPESAHVRVECGLTTEQAFLQSGAPHGISKPTSSTCVGSTRPAACQGQDFVMETVITTLDSQQGSGDAVQQDVPPVLSKLCSSPAKALTDVKSSNGIIWPSPANLSAGAVRRMQLPHELTLPRRFVPAVGK